MVQLFSCKPALLHSRKYTFAEAGGNVSIEYTILKTGFYSSYRFDEAKVSIGRMTAYSSIGKSQQSSHSSQRFQPPRTPIKGFL